MPKKDGQSSPMDVADKDQLDEPEQSDPLSEVEPIHLAESAKSITDSDSQTRQHKYNQAIQTRQEFCCCCGH